MVLILILYLCSVLSAIASAILHHRQFRQATFVVYSLAVMLLVGTAWLGWNFSPSFTMLFLAFGLSLCTVGELIWLCNGQIGAYKRLLKHLSHLTCSIGAVFALPAVYIYAAGDDWLERCVWIALITGIALCVATILRYHHNGKNLGAGPGIKLWLMFSAGCFALVCGLWSTALLPYGVGLLLLALAQAIPKEGQTIRAWCFWVGLLCASLMSTLPALC